MTDFVYATACIRSREEKMLTEDQFSQLLEMGSIDDICKVLQDAGYGGEGEHINLHNYEQKLKEKSIALIEYIKELCDDSIFDIFSYTADYHNIKVIIKGEMLGTKRPDILVSTGTIPPKEMVRDVNERDAIRLTPNMLAAVLEAVDNHARTGDPQAIDFICDKYCYMEINEAVEKSGNIFIKGYVALLIDTLNLKTCIRTRMMGKEWSYFSDLYIPGGNVDEKTFTDSYDYDLLQIAESFESFEIHEAVKGGLEVLESTGSFTHLEKLCDDALIKYIREARFKTFGIEALFAYVVSNQMEIKSVRILMTGKLAGMEPAIIKERMRATYE